MYMYLHVHVCMHVNHKRCGAEHKRLLYALYIIQDVVQDVVVTIKIRYSLHILQPLLTHQGPPHLTWHVLLLLLLSLRWVVRRERLMMATHIHTLMNGLVETT